MIGLRVEPGSTLDRSLQSAMNAFKSLAKSGKDEGIIRVYTLPSPEALITSAALFSLFVRKGLNVVLSASPDPPAKVLEPTVLVGYDSLGYNNEQVRDSLLAISQGLREPPPVNATYISVDGSLGASLLLILRASDDLRPEPDLAVALLASLYASKYIGKDGRPSGLDRIVADSLSEDEAIRLEMLTSLKAYRPHVMPLCSSLQVTLDPFYLGITGNPGGCDEALAGPETKGLGARKVTEMDEDELKRAARSILNYVKPRLRRQLEVTDFVGGVYVASDKLTLNDPRELLGAFMALLDLEGLGGATAMLSDYEVEYPQVQSLLNSLAVELNNMVSSWERISTYMSVLGIQGFKVRSDLRPPLYILWRALKFVGLVNNVPLAYEHDGRLVFSMPQIFEALGYTTLKRLASAKESEVRGTELWLAPPQGAS